MFDNQQQFEHLSQIPTSRNVDSMATFTVLLFDVDSNIKDPELHVTDGPRQQDVGFMEPVNTGERRGVQS